MKLEPVPDQTNGKFRLRRVAVRCDDTETRNILGSYNTVKNKQIIASCTWVNQPGAGMRFPLLNRQQGFFRQKNLLSLSLSLSL